MYSNRRKHESYYWSSFFAHRRLTFQTWPHQNSMYELYVYCICICTCIFVRVETHIYKHTKLNTYVWVQSAWNCVLEHYCWEEDFFKRLYLCNHSSFSYAVSLKKQFWIHLSHTKYSAIWVEIGPLFVCRIFDVYFLQKARITKQYLFEQLSLVHRPNVEVTNAEWTKRRTTKRRKPKRRMGQNIEWKKRRMGQNVEWN